mgnify:CR=1 FL=1
MSFRRNINRRKKYKNNYLKQHDEINALNIKNLKKITNENIPPHKKHKIQNTKYTKSKDITYRKQNKN